MLAHLHTRAYKKARTSFVPDMIGQSVADINFAYLKSLGITSCFVDLDGTVVDRGTFEVDPKVTQVLKESGLAVHIATNRPRSRNLKNLKQDLDAQSVVHPTGVFAKPAKRYYLHALHDLGLKPHEVVMIGDRYFQDVLGANRVGIYSLVVHTLGANTGITERLVSKIQASMTNRFERKYREV